MDVVIDLPQRTSDDGLNHLHAQREAFEFYRMVSRGRLSIAQARKDLAPSTEPDYAQHFTRMREYRQWVIEAFERLVAQPAEGLRS